ncbi:hypothetical protein SERLA73DRAFT_188484 [Serpula lacrymans var. lacrymans S7.3]|uniref:Methyltransferase domain-containing protein n=2 Tax=Serpula lacrymans var. lacrymans TaxID=341189 RepID=F8QBE4_SERL3|nr:uncharacterized protein SERLADRAFT_401469 [Serpula lacrymans var. lacrymans S7.9]EGN94530.1 hypothetical protein SERLA73DRAFT_188484 [Serpula lacrymans var. lacrymans S7.3]EGO20011.1 hypothetical protein SERLADRAFT_401469 [Serpula lacrymans var. lacrymans S7.9]
MAPLDPASIAQLSLYGSRFDVQLGQTEHRVNLVTAWKVQEGDHVLEIGCGQGDCTAVLATAVGETGKVTAIDPAPSEYGSPWTIGQAQSHLKASPIGNRMTFLRSNTESILASDDTIYDIAILAHCTWYFAAPSVLLATLRSLSTRAKRICIAEWALSASNVAAWPHVLAALTQASLECRNPNSKSNIRTVLSPVKIKAMALEAGLGLESEIAIQSPIGMLDGHWEVAEVLGDDFGKKISNVIENDRERGVVEALRDAVKVSKESLSPGTKMRAMDVWCGSFTGFTSEYAV